MTYVNNQKGATLLELLITLAISTIFVLAAATMMARNMNSYRPVQEAARLNDSTRSSFNFLTNSIRQAGYVGNSISLVPIRRYNSGQPLPPNWQPNFVNSMVDSPAATPNGSLQGRNFGVSAAIPAGFAFVEGVEGNSGTATWQPSGHTRMATNQEGDPFPAISTVIAPETDAITIRSIGFPNEAVTLAPAANGATVDASGVIPLEPGTTIRNTNTYVITDGERSEAFLANYNDATNSLQIAAALNNPGNNGGTLNYEDNYFNQPGGLPNPVTRVFPTTFVRYYIAEFDDVEGVTRGLFREVYDQNGDPIVQLVFPGVIDMQITYGSNIAGAINYFTADQLATPQMWASIESVRVGLLVKSASQIGIRPDAAYQYTATVNGNVYTENNVHDAFVRQVYELTIPLRNPV